jgi:preprotein translocase subunit SecB
MAEQNMKLSSLQLKQYFFTRLEVKARRDKDEVPLAGLTLHPFDFIGVTIGTDLEVGEVPAQGEDPRDFMIKLGIVLENKKGKIAPYDISVEVLGSFIVSPDIQVDKRRDFVVINGCAILYGALREIVLTMTSRFEAGGIVLPTINFVDHITSLVHLTEQSGAASQPDGNQS